MQFVLEMAPEQLAEKLYGCWRDTVAKTQQLDTRELRKRYHPWENLPPRQRDFWEAMAANLVRKSLFRDVDQ